MRCGNNGEFDSLFLDNEWWSGETQCRFVFQSLSGNQTHNQHVYIQTLFYCATMALKFFFLVGVKFDKLWFRNPMSQ